MIGEENVRQILVRNLHNANLLQRNLIGKVSLRDHLTETPHIKGVKTTFNNSIITNYCRILTFKLIVPN